MTSNSSKIKVIIADDHPVFRSGLEVVVKSLDFVIKVSQACNGEEVVKLLRHDNYNIVLMDIKMNPMDGIETTEIISARYPNTKVIALSMHDDEKHVLRMLEKGASGYLIKNANKDEISEAIIEVLNGKNYFSKEVSQILWQKLHQSKNNLSTESKTDVFQHERFRDIIFLIGHEFTSEEIGDILFLSSRTIEDYRSQILELTKSKSTVGLVKYALERGLLEDDKMKEKFAKALLRKS